MVTLDKDMISQTELWKLALLVTDCRLDVALFPPTPREEMIVSSFDFPNPASSALKSIEDIIYENPLLFSDFKRVDCIIDNCPQLLLPADIPADDLPEIYARSTDTAVDSDSPLAEPMIFSTADPRTIVAAAEPTDIDAFMRRTFYNIRFDSRIASLVRYFNSLSTAPAGYSFYAIARDGRMTLIVIRDHSVMLANSFSYKADVDAAYYILATASTLGIDPAELNLFISPASGELTDFLSPNIPNLYPIPFPMLRHRASKTTIQAPFELIIRPLCE